MGFALGVSIQARPKEGEEETIPHTQESEGRNPGTRNVLPRGHGALLLRGKGHLRPGFDDGAVAHLEVGRDTSGGALPSLPSSNPVYAPTMGPAMLNNIPILTKSTFLPDGEGTIITGDVVKVPQVMSFGWNTPGYA